MLKYKIIKENKEVPELSVIEKSGETVEINLAETLYSIEHNKKSLESIEAEKRIKDAVIVNVEENHSEVKEMSEQTLIAAAIYYESKKYSALAEQKITEIKEANKRLEKEVADIKKQTGIAKLSPEESKKIMEKIQSKAKKGKK